MFIVIISQQNKLIKKNYNFVLSFAMVCTLLAGVNVVAFAAEDTLSIICFYNDADKGGDGEHLFTKDEGEISWLSSLPTWNNQGEAWKAPVSSSLAVYRCYNPNSGEHHYAAAGEAAWLVSQGWTQEKLAFYSDDNQGVPVYRLWNGLAGVGSHYYTTNEFEKDLLVAGGWQFEGVNFYGVKGEEPTTKALSAAQVGSDKIMVSSEDGFTGEESFVVSHGDLVDEFAGVEYDEELDVYTITLADPIVDAVYTVSCDGYTPATFEGEEEPEKEMVAIQTGANEITVTSNTEFTELEDFTVTKGSSVQTLADDPVFVDDDIVVLTLDDAITPGEYTVSCSDEEYEPTSFVGQSAVLTTVEISDELIPDVTTGKYNVLVETLDQFGDDFVVDDWDGIIITKGTFSAWNGALGVLEITPPNPVEAGDETSITLVEGTLVTTATATYSNPSVPALVTVSSVEMTEAEAARNQTGRIDVDDLTGNDHSYYFVVNAMDQYGLPMTATQLNLASSGSYLIVSDGAKVITPSDAAPAYFDQEGDEVRMYVKAGSGRAGEGTITLIPVANTEGGATATMTVAENEKIDSITVSKALDNLQVNKPVPVLVTAENNYGEPVDFATEVVPAAGNAGTGAAVTLNYRAGSLNSGITTATMNVTGGIFAWDYATYPGGYSIVASPQTIPFVSVVTSGLQTKQFNFTPDAAGVPAGIYGLSENVQTTVAYSANTNAAIGFVPINNPANVLIKDQYGDEFGPATAFNGTNKTNAMNAMSGGTIFYTVNNNGTHTALTAEDDGIHYMSAATNTGEKAVTEKFVINAWVATADIAQNEAFAAKA